MSNQMQTTGGGRLSLRQRLDIPEAMKSIKDSLGGLMPVGKFRAQMMTAFNASPQVSKCTDESKFKAVLTCAALGLLPTLQQVALVPYKDELTALPQWQGYKALMERHSEVWEVQAVLVHKDDDYVAVNDLLDYHRFDPLDPDRKFDKMEDIKGGYCKITYRIPVPIKYHFVPLERIVKARNCAQTKKVWDQWFYQMALKTLYRDCYMRRAVPVDPLVDIHVQEALKVENAFIQNDPARPAREAKKLTVAEAMQTAKQGMEKPEVIDVPQQQEPETYRDFADLIAGSETIMEVDRHKTDALNVLTAADERADIESDADDRISAINDLMKE